MSFLDKKPAFKPQHKIFCTTVEEIINAINGLGWADIEINEANTRALDLQITDIQNQQYKDANEVISKVFG